MDGSGVGGLTSGSILNPNIPFNMENDMNGSCIGIMSINDARSPLSSPQIDANITLSNHLIKTYNIEPHKVIALSDWAPGRHIAPGPYFAWSKFAEHGLGLWSNTAITLEDMSKIIVSYRTQDIPEEVDHIQQGLAELSGKYHNAPPVSRQYVIRTEGLLTSHLGIMGVPGINDIEGRLGSETISCMFAFNTHHLGQGIIDSDSPYKTIYDEVLCSDPMNQYARNEIASWTVASEKALCGILDSYDE